MFSLDEPNRNDRLCRLFYYYYYVNPNLMKNMCPFFHQLYMTVHEMYMSIACQSIKKGCELSGGINIA